MKLVGMNTYFRVLEERKPKAAILRRRIENLRSAYFNAPDGQEQLIKCHLQYTVSQYKKLISLRSVK